jgi:ribosomal protein L40E
VKHAKMCSSNDTSCFLQAACDCGLEDVMNEKVVCKRCGAETDALEVFPGGICLTCYAAKEGQAPLTQSDFNGMVRTFRTGGRR